MIVNATTARQNLYSLINSVIDTEEPAVITSKRGAVVMISQEDYRSIQETLYLLSFPGMREKLIQGRETPLSECLEDPDD